MEARADLFLRELEQVMALRLVCLVALIVSVIEMFGKMLLVVAAYLMDDEEFTRVRIGHVIVQEAEEGAPNSLHHLYFKGLEESCSRLRSLGERVTKKTLGNCRQDQGSPWKDLYCHFQSWISI